GLSEGVGAEEVQHLEGGDALGRRRRLVNGDAAIGRGHRLAPARALLAQVLLGEEAAVGARVARHLARRLALVEAGAAERADALERAREVRVAQTLPGRGRKMAAASGQSARTLSASPVHRARRAVTSKPSRAQVTAGSRSRASESRPSAACASAQPPTAPGVVRVAGTMPRRGISSRPR